MATLDLVDIFKVEGNSEKYIYGACESDRRYLYNTRFSRVKGLYTLPIYVKDLPQVLSHEHLRKTPSWADHETSQPSWLMV